MRHRRGALALALVAGLSGLLGACAAPTSTTEVASSDISAPRDCEPQTGTRVPASCTKARASRSNAAAGEASPGNAAK